MGAGGSKYVKFNRISFMGGSSGEHAAFISLLSSFHWICLTNWIPTSGTQTATGIWTVKTQLGLVVMLDCHARKKILSVAYIIWPFLVICIDLHLLGMLQFYSHGAMGAINISSVAWLPQDIANKNVDFIGPTLSAPIRLISTPPYLNQTASHTQCR